MSDATVTVDEDELESVMKAMLGEDTGPVRVSSSAFVIEASPSAELEAEDAEVSLIQQPSAYSRQLESCL
jgi:hypothetical protein